ncbi:hypothetical protein KDU71_17925 [Carboxylicivirga sediminis]|uniref:DUF7670 domain-containing protein n=1 Tax=Carboxylicivirga sediminis TaxID=2006564 RepID=A0A941F6R2_9BACT|nr:hypothetical protein [Carboxylicivirga sediminis]MBR8537452.1 hypothetical protein [Carboxylicivirga sediminis]
MTKTGEILYWTPRFLCMVAIVVISMLTFEAFKPEFTSWHQLRTFFMQMVPSFALVLLLIFAWRRELAGGTFFIIIGAIMAFFVYKYHYHLSHSFIKSAWRVIIMAFPLCLTGCLFVMHYFYKRKRGNLIH